MAMAMASVTVAAGVQPLNAVATSSHAHLASASRLGGFRLNIEGVSLRTAGRPATVVVRAEEGVTDKVQNAAGDASREVKKAAGGLQGALENFWKFLSGKASEAQDSAQAAGRDAERRAERLGDQAADAGRDLEGSARNASRDARGDARNLGDKAQNALQDAGDSLQRNLDKATGSAQDAGKDLRREAERAGDAAQDTARDLKRDVQKGADRLSN